MLVETLGEHQEIPMELLRTSPDTLRNIDHDTVMDLAKSIRMNGLLQPILVRPTGSWYEVVFGNHRYQACIEIGCRTINAFVKKMSSEESLLYRIVENLQRNVHINPLNEAKGYIRLIDNGWTINKIANKIGKSDSYVSDRVGLIRRLHPAIANMYQTGAATRLKPSHLELLSRVKSKEHQLTLTNIITKNGLSVRRLEKIVSSSLPLQETVKAIGDSLYLPLPQKVVTNMDLHDGDSVYLSWNGRGKITMETAK